MMAADIVLERISPAVRDLIPDSRLLKRQRIYILPTRHGLLFAMMLFAMLLAAVNYNNNLAFLLTFFLGSVFLLSIVYTYKNLVGLVLHSVVPKAVFVGESICCPIEINNHSNDERFALVFSKILKKSDDHVTVEPCTVPTISKETVQTVLLKASYKRRGVFDITRYKLATCFPLGLFQAWSYMEPQVACIIYPRPAGPLPLPSLMLGQNFSQSQGSKWGGTDDFVGFSAYQTGDPIHRIFWKSLAKGVPPLVKRFADYSGVRLMLKWQDTAPLGDVESRLSQLSLWIVQSERHGIQYGLMLPSIHYDPDSGDVHYHRCLKALAMF